MPVSNINFEMRKEFVQRILNYTRVIFSRRCDSTESKNFKCEDHSLPFSNMLPFRPSIDDMRALYSTKKLREEVLFIPPRWDEDKVRIDFLS